MTSLTPSIMTVKNELKKGIDITPTTRSKLEDFIGGKLDEIEWISTNNHWVFKVVGVFGLIFKMANPSTSGAYRNGKMVARKAIVNLLYENKIKAKQVCMTHQLGLLVIPNAKKITLKLDEIEYDIIAEEVLNVDKNEFTQEELYQKYSINLDETARQIATFVSQTGMNVSWRSIPILHEASDYQGPRRIALIKLADMPDPVKGFIGDVIMSCRGLIRCLSKEQIDIVIEEAKKQKIILPEDKIQNAKQMRLKELESNEQLRQFHKRKGIITGNEILQVNVDALDLNLTEKAEICMSISMFEGYDVEGGKSICVCKQNRSITLRKVVEDVITEINNALKNSDKTTLREKRYVFLNTLEGPLHPYVNLNLPTGYAADEQIKQLWLPRIIQALIDKNHIFGLCKNYSSGYCIQA